MSYGYGSMLDRFGVVSLVFFFLSGGQGVVNPCWRSFVTTSSRKKGCLLWLVFLGAIVWFGVFGGKVIIGFIEG